MTVAQLIERLQQVPQTWTVDARVPAEAEQNFDYYVEDLFEVPFSARPGAAARDGWVTLVLGDQS